MQVACGMGFMTLLLCSANAIRYRCVGLIAAPFGDPGDLEPSSLSCMILRLYPEPKKSASGADTPCHDTKHFLNNTNTVYGQVP